MALQRLVEVLIVDDEPLARRRLRTLLRKSDGILVVGECGDGEEAVRAIGTLRPDLVFLDVQMPGIDGFEVIKTVGAKVMPAVVFVTAYDRFAVKAFEVNAVDYLLKPFDTERFDLALRRALLVLGRGESTASARIQSLLNAVVPPGHRASGRLLVKSADRVAILPTAHIVWVESAGNYVNIHAENRVFLLRESMKGILSRLDRSRFVQIHRGTIVNVERIKELQPHFGGDYVIRLDDGTILTLSRRYLNGLKSLLGHF